MTTATEPPRATAAATTANDAADVLFLCRRWRLCAALVFTCLCIETVVILSMGVHLYSPRFLTNLTLYDTTDGGGSGTTGDTATPERPTEPPPLEFLETYRKYCEAFLLPKSRAAAAAAADDRVNSETSLPFCPCVPTGLRGRLNVSKRLPTTVPTFGELELQHPELGVGGRWHPPDCAARSKVVVIVPFRDRESHLLVFVAHMHGILQRQMIDYRIIVVEQASPDVFNKASMMNIGFMEAQNLGDIDCVIFHDVDMLAEDDRNFYTCSKLPRHVGAYCDKWNHKLPYPRIFGGATAFQPQQFFAVNGFSNRFYGWGGEDDDMYNRIRAQKMDIARYPRSVSKFTMIKHNHDKGNPVNKNSGVGWDFRPHVYRRDGLNTLKYTLLTLEYRPLYTWIYAAVPEPRTDDDR